MCSDIILADQTKIYKYYLFLRKFNKNRFNNRDFAAF